MIRVHFIGIGGVSLSALAKYLLKRGFIVTGSDKKISDGSKDLENLGAKIVYFHDENNVKGSDVVIYNSAIKNDNPELNFALENKIPTFSRAELLNLISKNFKYRIGVSGSHGKTTVTSLISHILHAASSNFTAHIGGFDQVFGNFIDLGKQIFLSEVCEFNRNIDLYNPDLAVVTNIDNDHMNCYKDLDDLTRTFFRFLSKADVKIINGDDIRLKKYRKSAITFGIKNGDYTVIEVNRFKTCQSFKIIGTNDTRLEITTPFSSDYYIHDILAAVAVCKTLKISDENVLQGLSNFKGVKRRNEFLGERNSVKYYADYAHHPSEISCYLKSVTYKTNLDELYVIFQPHTYSRTKLLFNDFIKVFKDLKKLCLVKTYAAREVFDYDGSAKKLSEYLPNSRYFEDFFSLNGWIEDNVPKGCTVLIVGAGDVYDFFLEKLTK